MKPAARSSAVRWTAEATEVCCSEAMIPSRAVASVPKASLRGPTGPRLETSSRILARCFPPCSYSAFTCSLDRSTVRDSAASWFDIWLSSCTTVPEPEVPVSVPVFSPSASWLNRADAIWMSGRRPCAESA